MAPLTIHHGHTEHLAMAQLYRWFQFYEHPDAELSNQLDILANDVKLKTTLGEGRGHAQQTEWVGTIPAHWKSAHFVESSEFSPRGDGKFVLNLIVRHLNQGILPNNQIRQAHLAYKTELQTDESGLPKFTSIDVSQIDESKTDQFHSAYLDNRFKSLLHYWFAMVTNANIDLSPAHEVLSDDYLLNFSDAGIRSHDALEDWLKASVPKLAPSKVSLDELECETQNDGTLYCIADLTWTDVAGDNGMLKARTRHKWTIADDPKTRFANLKQIDVDLLEPFAPQE